MRGGLFKTCGYGQPSSTSTQYPLQVIQGEQVQVKARLIANQLRLALEFHNSSLALMLNYCTGYRRTGKGRSLLETAQALSQTEFP